MTKSPEKYTVGDILEMMEELAPVSCLGKEAIQCPRMASCRTLPMWKKLDDMIHHFFHGITIADLAFSAQSGGDYVI